MSRTYSFICEDCKKSAWAGQSHYLYKYDHISEFLHKHKNHSLKFIDDETMEDDIEECISLEEGFESKFDLGTCKSCTYFKGRHCEQPDSAAWRTTSDYGCILWEKKK